MNTSFPARPDTTAQPNEDKASPASLDALLNPAHIPESLSVDTCLQCGQTKAEVREKGTYCALEGGFESDEWENHHWRDWSDEELSFTGLLPEFFALYRRVSIFDCQWPSCEHSKLGHNILEQEDSEYKVKAGQCFNCGMMPVGAETRS